MKKIPTNTLKIIILCFGFFIALTVLFIGYQDIPIEQLKKKYTDSYSLFEKVNGMNVHYRDEGEKKDSIPIVLIHGTGSSLHTYEHWTRNLVKNHRVIRMDLPGYGLTGPFPNRNYYIGDYVDFLKCFLDEIGVKKCVLAGNSLGGNIACRFTLKYSDIVNKLILIAINTFIDHIVLLLAKPWTNLFTEIFLVLFLVWVLIPAHSISYF